MILYYKYDIFSNKESEKKMLGLKFQKVALQVTFYREGNKFIAHSTALDLSACGDTQAQAKKSFEETLKLFLEETDKMGTLEDVLLECGWKKIGRAHKSWQPPMFVGQTQEEVRLPCPA